MGMATVARVLPWRRNSAPTTVELAPLLTAYRGFHPKAPTGLIVAAYERAKAAHEGQVRKSGEAYIHHPLAVAVVVAGLGLDDQALAAALLHDAVEDTGVDLADIEIEFGATIANLVDGVTKLERVRFASREEQQAATVRKMLVAMSEDLRVLLIKLADRLHNMRTLAGLPLDKQRRIATETREIFAPLAHRLGMQELKTELEDLSFATLYPQRYAELDHLVSIRAPERELYLFQVLGEVQERLRELGIEAEVTGRPKQLSSIYDKMVHKERAFQEIFDLVGIRVVVGSVKDCWAALGSIHATWPPVQGRFKDYLSMPKFNLYQSLHTTVMGPGGKTIEVQLRTREMHHRAEKGVAAHWAYKAQTGGDTKANLAWLDRIVDWQEETTDPQAFMATLKTDLVAGEVYVFTPKGKVITLAGRATPVDFAYAVHTEVGHRCIGAKVNGTMVPLRSHLRSGDTVEIYTSKQSTSGPSQDWLQFVSTPRAANKIRQWFSRERREDARETGRDELTRALRREGLPTQKLPPSLLTEVAKGLNFADVEALHIAVGENHVSAQSVALRVGRLLRSGDPDQEAQLPAALHRRRSSSRRTDRRSGVRVEGLDDLMLQLSACCTPVPGDEIMGFVTRGRGVSVHRADCANAATLSGQGDRLIEVEWDLQNPGVSVAAVEVEALDRPSLLTEVSEVLASQQLNIVQCNMAAGPDRVAKMRFEFEIGDPVHLDVILTAIRRIDGVYRAFRAGPRARSPKPRATAGK